MAQLLSLSDAVAQNLFDGDVAAFEGFTHLIPHAAGHEAIRQGRRGLTLIRMTPDILYDQMIGMGMAAKVIFSYAGNPGVGLLRRMRDAIENGWPCRIETVEHSHAALANAWDAGAAGLPCAVFRGYLGAGLKAVNPDIRSVTCPFTGEELACVPALRPDVTFIHAQRASQRGDVLIEGIIGVQKAAALAAKRCVVTVEEIVDTLEGVHPNACVLPHWAVTAVVLAPGGAHPSYAHGIYGRDNAAYLAWDEVSSDRGQVLSFMREHVLEVGPEVFATRVAPLRAPP
jgi:glutaconate CoA-transferase subunit A